MAVSFSVLLQLEEDGPPVVAEALDISLGGLRLRSSAPFELFEQLALRMELPIRDVEGDVVLEPVDAIVAVVRRDPPEERPDVESYELALAFTFLPDLSERVIGRFMLQQLMISAE